ncbi:MAG: TIGR02444 family protein [Pseudomonadota bacterium]
MNRPQTLWDFSCHLYAKPGIQTLCLKLQNQHGCNVPLLLFCCWAGLRYGAVSAPQLQAAKDFSHDFSRELTQPLRQLRTTMKQDHPNTWPALGEQWQHMREQVKSLELASERILLDGLEQLSREWRQPPDLTNSALSNMLTCYPELSKDALMPLCSALG